MTKPWDTARWAIDAGDGAIVEIETSSSQTWALRALAAAGESGFRPAEDKQEHWATMTARLRDLGVPLLDLPPEASGRPGYRLGGSLKPMTQRRSGSQERSQSDQKIHEGGAS